MRIPRIVGAYPELLLVIAAAALGLAMGRPLRWADDHQAIDALLVVLVFATAVTVSANSLRRVLSSWKHLVIALVMGVTVLPVLSWLASRLVAAGSLRDGIMVVGIAPCEIASVATTALAGGGTALAGALLIGSTLLSVAFAGLILSVVGDNAHVHPLHILINLVLVVGIPLALGVVLASARNLSPRSIAAAEATATGALAGLVCLVAAQVHLGTAYVGVLLAILRRRGCLRSVGRGARTHLESGWGHLVASHHLHARLRHRRRSRHFRVRPGRGSTTGSLRGGCHPLGHRRRRVVAITIRSATSALDSSSLGPEPHAGLGQVRVRVAPEGLDRLARSTELAQAFGYPPLSGFGHQLAGVVTR